MLLPEAKTQLSKSRYLSGCQCPLRLWYDCYASHLADPPDLVQQAIFATGNAVGALARDRYPDGYLVDYGPRQPKEALAKTAELMADSAVGVIFEGAFFYKNVLVRVDVLKREPAGWKLIEVKSGTKVKGGVHDRDVAVQLWVLRGLNINVVSAGVLTLNSDYVYDGVSLDLDHLFAFHDLSELATALQPDVDHEIQVLQAMLRAESAPGNEPGEQCFKPYGCPYYAYCTRVTVFPDYPVGELPRLHKNRRQALEAAGVTTIPEVPVDFPLTERQTIVRDTVVNGVEYISDALFHALDSIEYPIYYLDFETSMPSIPRYAGTKPYESIPFQFSVHVEKANGSLKHVEFLHEDQSDPRRPLAHALIDALEQEGAICVYTNYEEKVIRRLVSALPELADPLNGLLDRLWDIKEVIANHYYHPDFHGSYSIKKVLPALVPELGYDSLAVQNGLEAAAVYEMALNSENPDERKKIFADLKAYCGLDTMAMVRLRGALKVKNPQP